MERTQTESPRRLQGTITEFAVPTNSGNLQAITAGPDGNLWFTDDTDVKAKIGRITPTGSIIEFPVPTHAGKYSKPADGLMSIVTGPDRALWYTEFAANRIGRITTAGAVTEYVLPNGGNAPSAITAGPDGRLWYTDFSGMIGVISTDGAVANRKQYPVCPSGVCAPLSSLNSGIAPDSAPDGIASGSDGNVWFTDAGLSCIGRISPRGEITLFPLPNRDSVGADITAGPDGNLWFTEAPESVGGSGGNRVGRITTSGAITEFQITTLNSQPTGITTGPDGALWFTEYKANQIGRITTDGVMTDYTVPTPESGPEDITTGPDGNIWFIESLGNNIGRLA